MPTQTRLNVIWYRLGKNLRQIKAAPALVEEISSLTKQFGRFLRKAPEVFDSTVRIEGFAPVRIQFHSLCQTAAVAAILPHAPADAKTPDVLCLMVNGLEGPEDIAAVKARVKLPPAVWKALNDAPKPVLLAAFRVNGRMRDPATTTVIHVLGNVYFNLFGTNTVGGAD